MIKNYNLTIRDFFGDSPRVRLMEYLIIGRNFQYNIKDMAEGAKISRPTCYLELKDLLNKEVIVKSEKMKGKQTYKLNPNLLK